MADITELVEDENKIHTVIGNDIKFSGTLKFKNSIKIKGNFEGRIESDGHLIIGREAEVSAEIKAGVVSINGSVNGKIKAEQKVEVYSKSKVSGDIISPDIFIESGSVFNGTCIMPDKIKEK
jgi:cytoskeletal protein CcmA (bactofilin family)